MPREYNISKLTRFSYSYEHIASLLSVFSQMPACRIMFLLDEEKKLEVKRIRKHLKDMQPFVISKALSLLRAHNIIEKSERTYVLKNNIFFRELYQATLEVLNLIGERPKDNIASVEDVKSVAELFSNLFFDNTSNILVHMLMIKPRKFNEIEEIYRHSHGYIPASTLRYHLSTRKLKVRDYPLRIFDFKSRDYSLADEGRKIHDTFDSFLNKYEKSIEAWIHDMWSLPLRHMTTETVPLADPRDSIHKLLRIAHTSDFVIVFSNEPKGIITTKNLMNTLGKNLGHAGFLTTMSAEDVMTPIDSTQVISGDTTLMKLCKKEGGFEHNHYIVDLGRGVYTILSLYTMLERVSVT